MPSPARADDLSTLMVKIAEGDQQAFAELYDATVAMVFGIVLRILRDHAQAEEVTQEVYVQAWRAGTRFDAEKGSVAAWLNTIAHRRAVDRVRSAARSLQRDVYDSVERSVDDPGDTADIVIAGEDRTRVREALAVLPTAQRTALAMAYFEGRSQREVADRLDVPLGTVKTRMRDGMRHLRDRLGEV